MLQMHEAVFEEGFHGPDSLFERTNQTSVTTDVTIARSEEDLHFGDISKDGCSVVLYEGAAFDGERRELTWKNNMGLFNQVDLGDFNDRTHSLRIAQKGCAVTVYEDGDWHVNAITFPHGWHPSQELSQFHGGVGKISSLTIHEEPLYINTHDHYAGRGRHFHDGNGDKVPDHEGALNEHLYPVSIIKYDTRSVCFQLGHDASQMVSVLIYYLGYFMYTVAFVFILLADVLRYCLGEWFFILAFPFIMLSKVAAWMFFVVYTLGSCIAYALYVLIFAVLALIDEPMQSVFGTGEDHVLVALAFVLVICLIQTHRWKSNEFLVHATLVFLIGLHLFRVRRLAWLVVQGAYCPLRLAMGSLIGAEDALSYWIAFFSLSRVDPEAAHFY